LGRRLPPPPDLVIALKDLPPPPANPFSDRLKTLLDEAGFEPFVEELCRPSYAEGCGRPGGPPGVYSRRLLVGDFEGRSSQRALAWRCADRRAALAFLGLPPHQAPPDHSSLTKIRQRLPDRVHDQGFVFVLQLAEDQGLRPGKTGGVASPLLEAPARLKTMVRRDSGADGKGYLRELATEAGFEAPTAADLRRLDRHRKNKQVSNAEWTSPGDPASTSARMKDGTTPLAYKAEHVVDLATEWVLAAPVYPADQPDGATLLESVAAAQVHLLEAARSVPLDDLGAQPEAGRAEGTVLEEAVADKGDHKAETLAECAAAGVRTYIPEVRRRQARVWTDKPPDWQAAYRHNRRRVHGRRSKRRPNLQREKVERTFAHACETGGGRRSWLRGLVEVGKRDLMLVAGHNLGIVMRRVFGLGTPRGLRGCRAVVGPRIAGWWSGRLCLAPAWSAVCGGVEMGRLEAVAQQPWFCYSPNS
jgi:IS5 family transposase